MHTRDKWMCILLGVFLLTRQASKPASDAQDSDVLTEALKEFADEFPQLMRPLIEERDEYMVFLLRTLATRCSSRAPTHCQNARL